MSFIETDKRHPIMWIKKWYIKSDQIAYICPTETCLVIG